jgi:hypothetical protein
VHRFESRANVRACFGEVDFGIVEELDVGEYEDPTQMGEQFYVFRIQRRQDVIRWQSTIDAQSIRGRIAQLTLYDDQGAGYRVEAACTEHRHLASGRYQYVFEAQLPAEITAPARERHGTDDLAAALLLDALAEPDGGGLDE